MSKCELNESGTQFEATAGVGRLLLSAYRLQLPRQRTRVQRAGVLNSVRTFFNVANDAVFIDHKGDAVGKQAGEAEDAVGFGNYLVCVAQQRKTGTGLFRELAVSLLSVEANAQNLRAGGLEFGDIRLISLDLARSTGSGCARIKS